MKATVFCLVILAFYARAAERTNDYDDALVRRDGEVDMGSISEYDIEERTSVLQKSDTWKNMSPEDRRRTAVEFYYTILGICEKKNIKQCSKSDAKFIAKTVGMGDPQCFFYCGFVEMVANADKLPGIHTLELAMEVGVGWNDDVNSVDDMESLDSRGRQGTGISIDKKGKDKRIFFLPVVFAAMGAIINVGSMAAIGYFSNERDLNDATRVASKTGVARTALKHLRPAARVVSKTRGCFDVKGTVLITDTSGNMLTKQLSDLKVGDNVQSVDDNGNIVFSHVYFIAHDDSSQIGKLLRVHYEAEEGEIGHIGLSDRHLIYATKSDAHFHTAEEAKPIMASELAKGDLVWVNSDEGGLVARKVSDVMPYFGHVIHPLTDNHHIIVNGVHASVHILEESAYRMLTAPLKFVCWLSPEAGKSAVVKKLVRFVEDVKEPFANKHIGSVLSGREMHMGMYGASQA